MIKKTNALLMTAALFAVLASPVYAQNADSPGTASDAPAGQSGGGAPLAGVYDETNVTPEAPMGKIEMSKSKMFTAAEKEEATGRCKVVSKNPTKYKTDVVDFCKGMM